MAYYGKYGHGLRAFAREWGLDNMQAEVLDPTVFDALQSFVNIISPERGYVLSFVDSGTAATQFATKRITCTSEALRGLYIGDINSWETGADTGKMGVRAMRSRVSKGARFYITAGMLCHEVSHIRYGQDTAGAVKKRYGKSRNYKLAQRISNILDENRIEAAFAWDFPGFADVFPWVIEWVARKSNGGKAVKTIGPIKDRSDALNAALMGSRFNRLTRTYDPTTQAALDWGKRWDKKYTKNDTVALHLAGVAAMIEWLKQFPAPERPEPDDDTTSCPPPFPPAPPQDDEDEGEDDGPDPIDFGDEDDEDEDDSDDQDGPIDFGPLDGENDETDDGGIKGPASDDEDEDDESDDEYDDEGNPYDEEEDDESEDKGIDAVEPVEEDEDEPPVLTEDEVEQATKDIPDTDGATKSEATREDANIEKKMREALGNLETIAAEESGDPVLITRQPKARDGVRTIPTGDAGIAHEVRLAFESTRYSHDEWASGYNTGRFRSRDAARAASGDLNVFSRRVSESSTRVHLALLVDYSGSMSGEPFDQACALAQTLVEAMEGSNVYRQSVWQYLSPNWRAGKQAVNLNRLWISGDAKAIRQALIDGGPSDSGTPTGSALYALCHEMVADRKVDEAMVVLSITDGDPDYEPYVVNAVQHWGERGVVVIGVNIQSADHLRPNTWYTRNKSEAEIEAMRDEFLANTKVKMERQYGEGRTIQFDGNWKHLAEDIGMVVGRALAGTVDQ